MEEIPEPIEMDHPMDVMRGYYTASGITFQEDDDALFTRLNLMNTEVQVICWGAQGRAGGPRKGRRVRQSHEFRGQAEILGARLRQRGTPPDQLY